MPPTLITFEVSERHKCTCLSHMWTCATMIHFCKDLLRTPFRPLQRLSHFVRERSCSDHAWIYPPTNVNVSVKYLWTAAHANISWRGNVRIFICTLVAEAKKEILVHLTSNVGFFPHCIFQQDLYFLLNYKKRMRGWGCLRQKLEIKDWRWRVKDLKRQNGAWASN